MVCAPFTSVLAEDLASDLLARFLRYVQIDTQSRRERASSPSTVGQLELARVLVSELAALGISDASLDVHGYVLATIPSNRASSPPIGLLAHLDTTPDAPGAGVQPLVHRHYDGGVISLPRDEVRLDPAEMPVLGRKIGHDIVTSSGDTLLGADDKAGVAEIMAAVAYLVAHPELPRAALRIAFTPDEEIGEGATLFDIERFGARCAYTLDGAEIGEIQAETFSAVEIVISVTGFDVHAGQATGRLVNALRLAARIVAALPSERLTPETTAGRDGFIHPNLLNGTPARAELRLVVRDFDDHALDQHVALVSQTALAVGSSEPRARVEVSVREQYRNMRKHLEPFPEVVEAAAMAIRAEGMEPVRVAARGGTDGSRLSERGLPTPNLFTGCHEYHSVREWASVQDMAAASATLVRLAGVWAGKPTWPVGDGR